MTIQTVAAAAGAVALSSSVRTQYVEDYLEAAMMARIYDQFAAPIGRPMEELKRGSSVQVEFLSDMTPGVTAISEVVDITPQALRDAVATLTPTSRAEALQTSELLLIQAYTNYGSQMYKAVGKNLMENCEILARNAATQGSNFRRGGTTGVSARSSVDAGTSGHRADDILFSSVAGRLESLKVPGFPGVTSGVSWGALTHPFVYGDIRQGGNVVSVAQYSRPEIILNSELGSLGNFRLIVSPWAKVFGTAGAANTNPVATTLNTAVNALATTMNVASAVQLGSYILGQPLWVLPTVETGNTHQPRAEMVRYAGFTASTITIVGEGANGGFRFPHSAGDAVRNADSVYTIVFGGPQSLAKVFATEIGEFGQIVGPKRDGVVDQFITLGNKWYGGYTILAQNRILRVEVSTQAEA